ncbi:hypothetical protein TUZN_1081 [Thermoproteus uzoniensis 768-20]|uniref:Uncharacterized protein n=1 Tax=Thermoproteus uzoniensis (strain 768-20) TaxID=999630 RepID=F2L079_THEU7|nr:hypothetical protein [Thermoproteus uzoniensis]AEA12561.1 hypothetical protein TUZN_1081 [Thermoproteus uzoniensis 768-20]
MRKFVIISVIVIAAVLAYLYARPTLLITSPYAELSPPDLGLVGFTAFNLGLRPVCITSIGGLPPGFLYQFHRAVVNGDVVAMEVTDKICIGPLSSVRLGEASYHIMIEGNITSLRLLNLTLVADNGQLIRLSVKPSMAAGPLS